MTDEFEVPEVVRLPRQAEQMRSCLPLVVTDAERDRAARILLGDDQWAAVLANSPSRFQQAQRAPRDPPSKGIGHAVETTQPEGILGSVRGYGEE